MAKIKGSKVAVTGATGMLGGELVRQLLAKGAVVRVVVRDVSRMPYFRGVEVYECQLTNPQELKEAFSGIDIVFNCAAKVSFRFDEIEKIVRTNTEITQHVVNACLDTKVGLLVHTSSIAALGEAKNGVIDESCYPENLSGWNGYSMSKYYSENEVWRGAKLGLNALVVNPSVILGEGDWRGEGSAALFAAYAGGMPFYTDGVTGYVDMRDVARAMIYLAECDDALGHRFILSAANLSYKDIITLSAASVGRRAPFVRAPKWLMHAIKNITGGRKLTDGLIKTAYTKSYYSADAIKKLGFEFTPIDETIKYIGEQYKASKR